MKWSIRKQFTFIFIGLMAGIIFLCWLTNTVFLERYYENSKHKALFKAYKEIREAAKSDEYNSDSFVNEINHICSRDNISICVLDVNSKTKYTSFNGGEQLEMRLLGYIFDRPMSGKVEVLEVGDDYWLQTAYTESGEFMEMYGRLASGISFIMRTPIESIQESAALANRFYFYVGLLGTFAGALFIWLVARRITKPILKLNDISQKMVELDFEAKYESKAHNELDMLGENMNRLSASLETSISELKTANNELKVDIAKREQIDEMRKDFLNNVSHELKTPIALIQGYAEGLAEGVNEDEESRQFYCEVIMDEASKMNLMVKKLLTLNQLEFGNDIINMERFDLATLVQNCIQSAEILLKQNNIKVINRISDPIYVWADEFKLEEVFINYLTNAINHCDGEKIITITIQRKADTVRVFVENTGRHIPEESLALLWDKFYKVDKARTREYGGTGIGLSIVKAIMESLHQEYGVENTDAGVRFWFEVDAGKEEK